MFGQNRYFFSKCAQTSLNLKIIDQILSNEVNFEFWTIFTKFGQIQVQTFFFYYVYRYNQENHGFTDYNTVSKFNENQKLAIFRI